MESFVCSFSETINERARGKTSSVIPTVFAVVGTKLFQTRLSTLRTRPWRVMDFKTVYSSYPPPAEHPHVVLLAFLLIFFISWMDGWWLSLWSER